MLGRPIQSLVEPTKDSPATISFDKSESYTADCIIKVDRKSDENTRHVQHKAIVILSKPISVYKPAQESDEEEDIPLESNTCENALLIIPPGGLGEDMPVQPTMALMAGEGSFSAPSGQCECCF